MYLNNTNSKEMSKKAAEVKEANRNERNLRAAEVKEANRKEINRRETNLKEINLSEMNLGYFGILVGEVEQLQKMFHSVEMLRLPFGKKYDLYYIDLSFASSRLLNSIRNEDSIPLIVKNRFEHPSEKLTFLHEDSYLCLETGKDYLTEEFTDLVKSYLKRYSEKQVDYQLYKVVADVKPCMKPNMQEKQLNPPILLTEENNGKPREDKYEIRSTRDVWERWKRRHDVIISI